MANGVDTLSEPTVEDRDALENRLAGIEDKMSRLLAEVVEIKSLLSRPMPSPAAESLSSEENKAISRPLELNFEAWLANKS